MKNILLKLRLCTLLLIVYCTLSSILGAQDKKQDIVKLIAITNTQDVVDKLTDAMIVKMNTIFKDKYKKKVAKNKIDQFLKVVEKEIKNTMDMIVKEDLVTVFDKNFTYDEVKEILRFYESSSGQKLLKMTPVLSQNIKDLIDKKYRDKIINKLQNEAKVFLSGTKN